MINEQEKRERLQNFIACMQAKLNGKPLEWRSEMQNKWIPVEETDWNFTTMTEVRVVPEPQEKLKRWCTIVGNNSLGGHAPEGWFVTYESLESAKAAYPNNTIIELTETARIEPKKREPRRRWVNVYASQESIFPAKDHAERASSGFAHETAVEFVEVVK